MNDAHFHLTINHFPIIIPFVGFFVMAVGLIFRSEIVKRSAFISIFETISSLGAFVTGDGAEEALGNLRGIDKVFIKRMKKQPKLSPYCFIY